jgi:hypothetical protein
MDIRRSNCMGGILPAHQVEIDAHAGATEGLRRPARGRHVKEPSAPGATEMLYEFLVRCDDWLEILASEIGPFVVMHARPAVFICSAQVRSCVVMMNCVPGNTDLSSLQNWRRCAVSTDITTSSSSANVNRSPNRRFISARYRHTSCRTHLRSTSQTIRSALLED